MCVCVCIFNGIRIESRVCVCIVYACVFVCVCVMYVRAKCGRIAIKYAMLTDNLEMHDRLLYRARIICIMHG